MAEPPITSSSGKGRLQNRVLVSVIYFGGIGLMTPKGVRAAISSTAVLDQILVAEMDAKFSMGLDHQMAIPDIRANCQARACNFTTLSRVGLTMCFKLAAQSSNASRFSSR